MRKTVVHLREAKTHLSRLIDRAAKGEEILIARFKVGREFFDELPAEELEPWK